MTEKMSCESREMWIGLALNFQRLSDIIRAGLRGESPFGTPTEESDDD